MTYQVYDAPEYAASKAGLIHLTAALGSLQSAYGIRANCICPGWVETEAVKRSLDQMTPGEIQGLVIPPPPKLIQPGEIAEVVVMFIQDERLAGRVLVWPDGERPQLIPDDQRFRY